jgi:hypothetical protein
MVASWRNRLVAEFARIQSLHLKPGNYSLSGHRLSRYLARVLFVMLAFAGAVRGQDFNAIRDDQINRLKNYTLDAILPSGLVRDSLVLNGASFHPATPDAAGFALIALSAFDHLGKLPDAAARVQTILSSYSGLTPGVVPDRSADGHFTHFMNIATGAKAGGGWDASYSPIGSALLVAGAQFAKNQFAGNATIAALTDQLTQSINFNAAIHPSLDGRIYLDMTKAGGGGSSGTVRPFNEYMLVESLALREPNNTRALAVRQRWLDVDNLPKRTFNGIPTLTDSGSFAPAFWEQQMHFFNGDFRESADFEIYFANQQAADKSYSELALGEASRYGLTAGVSPQGYHADRILDHPNAVFSPEAVAAWGDMDTLVDFYNTQIPTSNPSYKYGLVRQSLDQPNWIPFDAGLVDHMFLLFGLVESLDPTFFADRVLPGLKAGDYNADGVVNSADYNVWRASYGATALSQLAADGNGKGTIDAADYVIWRNGLADGSGSSPAVPEPAAGMLLCVVAISFAFRRSRGASPVD